MTSRRVTAVDLIDVLYILGVVAIAAGVALLTGDPAWACIVGGLGSIIAAIRGEFLS